MDSALVGTMTFIEFLSENPHRKLTISPCDDDGMVTVYVENGGNRRAIYDLDASCMLSLDLFLEALKKQPSMLASLRGAPEVDTPVDWQNYRRKEDA